MLSIDVVSARVDLDELLGREADAAEVRGSPRREIPLVAVEREPDRGEVRRRTAAAVVAKRDLGAAPGIVRGGDDQLRERLARPAALEERVDHRPAGPAEIAEVSEDHRRGLAHVAALEERAHRVDPIAVAGANGGAVDLLSDLRRVDLAGPDQELAEPEVAALHVAPRAHDEIAPSCGDPGSSGLGAGSIEDRGAELRERRAGEGRRHAHRDDPTREHGGVSDDGQTEHGESSRHSTTSVAPRDYISRTRRKIGSIFPIFIRWQEIAPRRLAASPPRTQPGRSWSGE